MEDYVHMFTMLMIVVHVCLSSTTIDPNMCGKGECCIDYTIEGDQCIVCPNGTHGENCSKLCQDGLYGEKCKKKCPSECNKTCDKVSGSCSGHGLDYTKDNRSKTSFEGKLADFLEENMWMIIGISSIFLCFSCIGTITYCKIWSKKKTVTRTFLSSDQNNQQLNGLRYESDGVFSNNSSTLQPPPRIRENNTPRGDNVATQPECENSKSKKRYSLVRKITISREMTSHSEYSDDNEDLYDSGEFDDSFDVCKKVQISDLPKKDSFKMFQSEDIKSKETYGKVWL
ncbi:uncharacterized protein LOC128190864 isoform X2 [Crassostrea angulata]|uniref:uncharacterized protein LOC128190864 isoform X2 n=1 Tax=Magallana angulata TaxID=2784310 RepID=UPI0022B0C532|nr:uncharacterized protein LOC128190864 isoform X2 [Crassostrea angulata]